MKKMFNKLTSAIKSMINGQKRKQVEPEPVCGGVTDKSDPNAPKEILSKDIVEFCAVFYLHTRQIAGRKGFFAFSVKADEGGVLETTEEHSKTVCVADRSLMAELQAVIDKNELALKNGVYRVTGGFLPNTENVYYTLNMLREKRLISPLTTTQLRNGQRWYTMFLRIVFLKKEWFLTLKALRNKNSLQNPTDNHPTKNAARLHLQRFEF